MAMEANVEGLWIAKQPGRGTPATAPATTAAGRRLRKVGGGLNPNPAHGNENYSDGTRFSGAVDFVDTIAGGGAPVVQANPQDLAYLTYLALGAETVGAAVTGVLPHTITPNNSGGFWLTAWKKVGATTVQRQQFNDCRIGSFRMEASSANKVLKATPTLISLDPAVTYTTDPTVVVDPDLPFVYTDAVGTFTIDGVVFKGQSSFALVINDNLAPWYGDDVIAQDIVSGQGTIAVEGITIIVDNQGLQQYNRIVYGNANPVAGSRPQRAAYTGSYTFTLTRGTGATLRSYQVTLSLVHWTPDVAIDGNPDGGPIELSLGAESRAGISIVANVTDPAYT